MYLQILNTKSSSNNSESSFSLTESVALNIGAPLTGDWTCQCQLNSELNVDAWINASWKAAKTSEPIKGHKPKTLGTTAVCFFLDAASPNHPWTCWPSQQREPNKTVRWPCWSVERSNVIIFEPTFKHFIIISPCIFQSSSSLSLRDTEVSPSALPCTLTAWWWPESVPAVSTATLQASSRAGRAASGWVGWLVGYPVTGQISSSGRRTVQHWQKIWN